MLIKKAELKNHTHKKIENTRMDPSNPNYNTKWIAGLLFTIKLLAQQLHKDYIL